MGKDNKKTRETRLFPSKLETRDDGTRTMTGYAAVFNTLSEDLGGFREQIAPGAFAEVLNDDVRALYNHNSDLLPLGRTPDTLRLIEDGRGLKVEVDLPDTQFARDLVVSIERGDVSQMSFGFSVSMDGQKWEDREIDGKKQTVRTLTRIKRLYDVSPVVFPAYPDTEVAVRCLECARRTSGGGVAIRRRRLELHEKTISSRW